MVYNKSTVTVTSSEAFQTLSNKLEMGERYTFRQIKQVLIDNFEGINSDQCSSIIHRAHSNKNGVLTKENKFYLLRIESVESIDGLTMAKLILKEALRKIDKIPASELKTVEKFNELLKIRKELSLLVKEEVLTEI